MVYYEMFGFVSQIFVSAIMLSGCNILNANILNANAKVFNIISRTNETRYIGWHGTCRCKCRLNANVCNNKRKQNKDKCRCECKELIDKGSCDKGFIWNLSNCDFVIKCHKSCDVGEYLDYKNCKCRNKLVDRLVEECTENIGKNKMIYNKTLNDYGNLYNSCAVCIVLLVIFLIVSISVSSAFF